MKLPSLLQDSAGLPIEHVLLLLLLLLMLLLLMLMLLMWSRVPGSTHRLLLPAVWAGGSQASQQSAALCGWLVPNTPLPPPLSTGSCSPPTLISYVLPGFRFYFTSLATSQFFSQLNCLLRQ